MIKFALLLSFAFPAVAFGNINRIPSLGLEAVYDDATGFVEISKAGVATIIKERVGAGRVNPVLLQDLAQSGIILYERGGTALILSATPQSLTLISKTNLPNSGFPGADAIGEGFRYLTSPTGLISVAIFRQAYRHQIGSLRVTSQLRTILSSASPACMNLVDSQLKLPQTVDRGWDDAIAVIRTILFSRENECATGSFGYSLPNL